MVCTTCDLKEGDDGTITYPRLGIARRFIKELRNGWEDGIPICCVIRFAIENAMYDGKTIHEEQGSATLRGVVFMARSCDDEVFVPCNVFHKADLSWDEWEHR